MRRIVRKIHHSEGQASKSALSSPRPSNLGLTAILLGVVAAGICLIVLILAGYSLFKSLIIAVAIEIFVACAVIVFGAFRLRKLDLQPDVSVGHCEASTKPQDIWRTYLPALQSDVAVRTALVAPNTGQSRSIAKDLAELGHETHHSTSAEAVLDCLMSAPNVWDMLIFDLDSSPDLDDAVDDLLEFRKACPTIPVLLLSSTVLGDDLSHQRRWIGDATLRKPIFRKRLIAGLFAANANFAAAG